MGEKVRAFFTDLVRKTSNTAAFLFRETQGQVVFLALPVIKVTMVRKATKEIQALLPTEDPVQGAIVGSTVILGSRERKA